MPVHPPPPQPHHQHLHSLWCRVTGGCQSHGHSQTGAWGALVAQSALPPQSAQSAPAWGGWVTAGGQRQGTAQGRPARREGVLASSVPFQCVLAVQVVERSCPMRVSQQANFPAEGTPTEEVEWSPPRPQPPHPHPVVSHRPLHSLAVCRANSGCLPLPPGPPVMRYSPQLAAVTPGTQQRCLVSQHPAGGMRGGAGPP